MRPSIVRTASLLLGIACLAASPPGASTSPSRRAAAPATRPAQSTIVLSGPADPTGGKPLTVTLDFSAAPEHKNWAIEAGEYAIRWHPQLATLLASEGFTPARDVTLVFKHMDGVAFCSGNTITIAAKWIKDHPDDFGMVVHELTHVLQNYPSRRGNPGWLVEGIADYVRYYVVEPDSPRRRFNPERESYERGYQPAAGMLHWLEQTAGPGVITQLNRALRDGRYSPRLFREIAGGDPGAVWERYKASLAKRSTTKPTTTRTTRAR